MMVVVTVISALACLALVATEFRHHAALRAGTKTIASIAFIVLGLLAMQRGGSSPHATWIVIGLVLGAIGDVALLGKSDKAFLAGLGAFLAGHIAYVVAIAQLSPPSEWLHLGGPFVVAPIVVGAGALAWLWRHLGTMKVPVIAYVLTIVSMVIGAIAVREHHLLALGAVLFFASDLAVARDKFLAPSVVNRAWGLPCYYAGQILIAWSLAS